MPRSLAENVHTWRQLHPTWKLRIWRDDDLRWLEHVDLYDRAPLLVPFDAIGQLRSDIARYEILAKYGGFYADCDTRPLRPIDRALNGLDAFAAWEDATWVGNTYLGATPFHPVMLELIAGMRASITSGARMHMRPNRLTGPRYLTPIWRRHNCHVAPTRLWYPFSFMDAYRGRTLDERRYPEAYAVHQWRHIRSVRTARA